MENQDLIAPYATETRKPVFTILRFSPKLGTLERPAARAKARIFCPLCKRHHHLQWGEMSNAIQKHGATTLEGIVEAYAWKYCQVTIYDNYISRNSLELVETLTTELQALHEDVDVIECVHRRKNIFAMKIQTPRKVYLDELTREQWRDLVMQDIKKCEQRAQCPFCFSDVVTNPKVQCTKCGAHGYSSYIVGQDGVAAIQDLMQALTPSGAYRLLANFSALFATSELPHGYEVFWVNTVAVEKYRTRDTDSAYAKAAETARGIYHTGIPIRKALPLLLNSENADESDAEEILGAKQVNDIDLQRYMTSEYPELTLPSCLLCKYAMPFTNNDAGWFASDDYCCTFPTEAGQVEKHLREAVEVCCISSLGFQSERSDRLSSAKLSMNIVWNHILETALSTFPDVSDQGRGLEGLDQSTGVFHGPICPDFVLNDAHIDIGDRFVSTSLTAQLLFGVENFAARQAEAERINKQSELEKRYNACLESMTILKKYGCAEDMTVMRTRVTMENFNSKEGARLRQFFDANIDRELLHSHYMDVFRRFFVVSNKVWALLCHR